jgi:hypothetical protein
LPAYNIPIIDNVSWNIGGPLTDQDIAATFGRTINPLTTGEGSPAAGVAQIDTTFASPGEFQKFVLICGIQWRFDFEPQVCTVLGNSLTTPTSGQAIPVSPDDLTAADSAATPGTLGLLTGQTLTPAALQWGYWAELAAYYMALGYNLEWQYGNRETLLNESLQFTAFAPTVGEGASDSDVDAYELVRRTNDYYRTELATTGIFLTADRSRLGNESLIVGDTPTAGQSVYRPTREYEIVGATYGGTVLKALLKGRSEFKRLGCPFLIAAGVPIGLKAVEANATYAQLMRSCLSATSGYGGNIPATFTPDVNINPGASQAGAAGLTGVEPSFDATSVPNSIQLLGQRTVFKGGTWRLTMAFRGFELVPEQTQFLIDPAFRDRIKAECGCSCYVRL